MSDNLVNPKQDEEILCRRCGRRLKGIKSRELGFGPACYKAWKSERLQHVGLFSNIDSVGDDNGKG